MMYSLMYRELGIPDEDSIIRLEKLDRPELQFIIQEVVADIKPEKGLSLITSKRWEKLNRLKYIK